ncbi:thymidylate kinase [Chthonomonas calidirosea]|uniref:Thymidylate kinase n=1 Tax=Chthonomonas calidirosea (strain DSM 23976 / ICMP 18418 / T49) TaxID=1303518 RepID=S0EZL9_CHTCT|nr:dTMP kinase [Chthonomonas calidirosea]CCW35923.1 thymidylate kinase [Chthonomonas calidirosea T49]CEK17812.1 thymidylate kinase [Chthonomonas calidirosea]CEK17813.1 thymidylate kinase [Chthonomonas calidirosea]CEK18848.1 thymidylate kinase [Chthonomonas calidirosea]
MLSNGRLITFEGIDGAGKSTQLSLLRQVLQQKGYEVLVTREPGGDAVGEEVRRLLLQQCMVPRAELLLFLASRAQNTEVVIRPALASGIIVLCDRYIDSSVAYQGYGRDLHPETIEQLNNFATNSLVPDLTILLDLPPEIGLERQTQKNRMEEAGLTFLQRVREGYLLLAQKYPERIRTLDARRPPEEIHREVCTLVFELLAGRTMETRGSKV